MTTGADKGDDGKIHPDYDYTAHIATRLFVASSVSSIIGASVGYYQNAGIFLYFYTYGIAAGAVALPFFTSQYLLKFARKQDDVYNYIVSGSLTGGLLGSLRGRRGMVIGSVGAAMIGGGYKMVGDLLYQYSRNLWLENRIRSIHNSRPSGRISRYADDRAQYYKDIGICSAEGRRKQ
jgi:hypothetical protein